MPFSVLSQVLRHQDSGCWCPTHISSGLEIIIFLGSPAARTNISLSRISSRIHSDQWLHRRKCWRINVYFRSPLPILSNNLWESVHKYPSYLPPLPRPDKINSETGFLHLLPQFPTWALKLEGASKSPTGFARPDCWSHMHTSCFSRPGAGPENLHF